MRTALAAGVVALLVYLRTLAPGITEIDSGELAAVAATLGIAHPSGYPLFSMVGRAWTMATAGLRVITWMNILSAVLCAGAVVLLFRVIRDLLPERVGAARTAGAWVGALAFAFHGTLWSVAVVTEVHALQMFLDAALLHAVVRGGLWGRGPVRERALLAGGYFAGLALANHLTAALLLPGVGVAAWLRRKAIRPRVALAAVGAAVLGSSVYAFLPIRSAQHPWLDWGSPHTWETLVRHVTGAQYRVWMFTSGEALRANLGQLMEGLPGFSWVLLALVPVGLRRARRVPGLLAGSVTMAVLATAYPLGYQIHDIATYFLPLYLIAAVWIGLGAVQVVEWAERRSPSIQRLAAAVFLLPVVPLVLNWEDADRSRDTAIEAMAHSFLATPRENAVVVSAYWDVLMSPSIYLQRVEGVRPDLVVLDQEHFRRRWMVPWLRSHVPEVLDGLEAEADRLHGLVLRFERGQPYDPAEIQAAFEALIDGILENGAARGGAYVTPEVEGGIGAARVRVPDGLLFRLDSPTDEAHLGPEPPWPVLPGPDRRGEWLDRVREYAARMATLRAMAAERLGDRETARGDLQRALEWNPEEPMAMRLREALGP